MKYGERNEKVKEERMRERENRIKKKDMQKL